jgi:hypothetical protein
MFHAFRSARLGRAVLLLAAVFAVAGSFGLHPEPASELAPPLAALSQGSAPVWTAAPGSEGQTDPCTACLAHRFVSLTGLAVFSPAGTAAIPVAPLPQARLLPLSAPRFVEGRAPPSAG